MQDKARGPFQAWQILLALKRLPCTVRHGAGSDAVSQEDNPDLGGLPPAGLLLLPLLRRLFGHQRGTVPIASTGDKMSGGNTRGSIRYIRAPSSRRALPCALKVQRSSSGRNHEDRHHTVPGRGPRRHAPYHGGRTRLIPLVLDFSSVRNRRRHALALTVTG